MDKIGIAAYAAIVPTGTRPPIPPGVARVAISGTFFTHRFVHVFYLQLTHTTVTVNDLQSLADEISTLWNTNIAPKSVSNVTLTSVAVTFIDAPGSEVVYQGTYSHAGTYAGTAVNDASLCYVVNWKISAYYRGGHPRTYMPGLTTADITNGSDINSTSASGVATAWNTFRNSLNAYTTTNISAIVMGTLSFQTANAWRTTPVFRPYTSVSVNPKAGSQRRRIHS